MLDGTYSARPVWSRATVVEALFRSEKYSDGLDGSALMIAKCYGDDIHSPNFHSLKFVTNDSERGKLLRSTIGSPSSPKTCASSTSR